MRHGTSQIYPPYCTALNISVNYWIPCSKVASERLVLASGTYRISFTATALTHQWKGEKLEELYQKLNLKQCKRESISVHPAKLPLLTLI